MLTINDVTPADAGEVVFNIKDLSSKTTLTVEGKLQIYFKGPVCKIYGDLLAEYDRNGI